MNTQQFHPIIGRIQRTTVISISWNSVFQLTLPFTGVWTHSRVAVRPNHWTNSANRRASIISISWDSVFQLTLPFTGVWTHSRVAVRPNHWTNSANSRASIISISWNSVFELTLSSHLLAFEHTAVRPNPTQHQHQLELRFSTHAPIYARLHTPQGSSATQSLGEFRTAGRASSASSWHSVFELTLSSSGV